MKLETSPKLQEAAQKALHVARQVVSRYMLLVLFLPFAAVYAGIVLRINQLSRAEPTSTQLETTLQKTARPSINKDSLAKIQQLQAQNIQVQTLFDQARQNPFSE